MSKFESDEDRERWLEERNFEVSNTSHATWHVKDLDNLGQIIYEFTLYYNGCRMYRYQVGYYGQALLFFKKWAVERGFDDKVGNVYPLYRVWVKYRVEEDNTVRYDDGLFGYFATEEIAEDFIKKNMEQPHNKYLKREFFTVTKIDSPYEEGHRQKGY